MSEVDVLEPRSAAFLGVEHSVRGKRWRDRLADERAALALSQQTGLPEIVGRVLVARGVAAEDVDGFLNPSLRSLLPDPSHLRDMDVAVERLVRAITNGETVAVFGDYDVDGATSSALLVRYFAALGRETPVYIPDRQSEGYGPNAPALRKLKQAGASVVVTVDCGTTAFDALSAAAEDGLDVIVLDHHVAEPRLPAAHAVVNPNRLDETSAHGELAAVGVTFLLVVALNRALRQAEWFGKGHQEPNLLGWLDIVALGTVCDVAPLTGLNRALVTQGLKVMAGRGNPGLAALADVAGLDSRPDAYHLGFVMGPRVNAGGRVGEAGLGARLLATGEPAEARAMAERLDGYNKERQRIEAEVLEAAMAQAKEQAVDDPPAIVVADHGWHPGVIGIVAGRLKEEFDRPACVIALENGEGKGSGRSVPGVKLGSAIIAAHQAGCLLGGGGHDMAAGFSVSADRLDDFRVFLNDHVLRQDADMERARDLRLDGSLAPTGATVDLVETLDALGPFGAGNARPRFAFPSARIVKADIVGKDHVRCFVTAADGGNRIKAIAFRAAGKPLGEALLRSGGVPLHLAGHLRIDTWGGTPTVQLVIEDAAWPSGSD